MSFAATAKNATATTANITIPKSAINANMTLPPWV